jgi:hypothetical protein
MNPDKLNLFECLTLMNKRQLEFFFSSISPEDADYILKEIQAIGTELNMAIAELHDEVEDLALAGSVLSSFTLSGKVK